MQQDKITKAEQARINGSKSTGPKTPEGLQRCRQASIKHGMWVAHLCTFSHEAQQDYAAVLTAAMDQFRPRNLVETSVVRLLADALWRSNRLGSLANLDIDREMFLINRQSTTEHEPVELHLLAEQNSKSVARLEARARHYTREIARLMDILRKLQNWPVSTEASQMSNEYLDSTNEEVPRKEPARAEKPVSQPQPVRKPVQSANSKPQKGSVPRRK